MLYFLFLIVGISLVCMIVLSYDLFVSVGVGMSLLQIEFFLDRQTTYFDPEFLKYTLR